METGRKIQEKKRIRGPTHSKGRHAACISITAIRKTHLTTGINLVVWLFRCKLSLLHSLFCITVITFSHYVVPQLLRSMDRSFARSKTWKSRDQKHLIIHELQTFFNPLERNVGVVVASSCFSFLFFGLLFHITTTTTKKRVINRDNKIKSMRGVCNLFNAQYSWVSARK